MVETKGRPMVSRFPDKEERIFYNKLRRARGRKADVELLPRGGADAGAPAAEAQAPEAEKKWSIGVIRNGE